MIKGKFSAQLKEKTLRNCTKKGLCASCKGCCLVNEYNFLERWECDGYINYKEVEK